MLGTIGTSCGVRTGLCINLGAQPYVRVRASQLLTM